MDLIKQLRIYPPEKGNCKIIVVYEVPDQEEFPQNGHELCHCRGYPEYPERKRTHNADAVGVYNILRKYHSVSGVKKELSVTGLKTPEIIKVAV